MKLLIEFAIFLSSQLAAASMADYTMMIQGKLQSYSKTEVVIKQESGTKIRVPASVLPDKDGLIAGKATVTVFVKPKDLIAMNPELFKKKKVSETR